jgi:hypothetical protein
MPPEPSGESRLIQLSAGEGENQYHDFFLRGFDAKPVEPEEEVHGLECDTLVAGYEGTVVGKPESISCIQGRKVRVRVVVAPISRTLECRLQETAVANTEGPAMGLGIVVPAELPMARMVVCLAMRLSSCPSITTAVMTIDPQIKDTRGGQAPPNVCVAADRDLSWAEELERFSTAFLPFIHFHAVVVQELLAGAIDERSARV